MSQTLLQVEHLKKTFPVSGGLFSGAQQHVHAVNDVSFSLQTGETLGLVGESGCGKSTIARLALCLDRPDSGTIRFKGKSIYEYTKAEMLQFRRNVQIIFQDPFSSLNPRKKVRSIIGEPLKIHQIARGADITERVLELMDLVGLRKDQLDRYPHEFSSGQRQRIGVARALSLGPELIVCDEPVSALDVSIQAQTINLLMDLQERMHLTYVFISHDLSVVRYVSTRVAVMYLGRIVETAGRDSLYDNPLHPYTQALLSAVPVPEPGRVKDHITLAGEMPSPIDMPAGCVFAGRCPLMDPALCLEAQPPLQDKGSGHRVACFKR
ncbi:MAG: dipeptide ABC transporter ATP-binding protein [Deltaproteobacteria bacterium]|nr:dipeptide ABC transporter ATP-binding protein [Deltaproteobacteria bacterium]